MISRVHVFDETSGNAQTFSISRPRVGHRKIVRPASAVVQGGGEVTLVDESNLLVDKVKRVAVWVRLHQLDELLLLFFVHRLLSFIRCEGHTLQCIPILYYVCHQLECVEPR